VPLAHLSRPDSHRGARLPGADRQQSSHRRRGDFNEDGIPDLAIENAGDNTVSILLGNGDGTFTAAPNSPIRGIGTLPCESINQQSNCAIVVGDFNDDGYADLALTIPNDGTVFVLRGSGQDRSRRSGVPNFRGEFSRSFKNRRFQQRRNSRFGSR